MFARHARRRLEKWPGSIPWSGVFHNAKDNEIAKCYSHFFERIRCFSRLRLITLVVSGVHLALHPDNTLRPCQTVNKLLILAMSALYAQRI